MSWQRCGEARGSMSGWDDDVLYAVHEDGLPKGETVRGAQSKAYHDDEADDVARREESPWTGEGRVWVRLVEVVVVERAEAGEEAGERASHDDRCFVQPCARLHNPCLSCTRSELRLCPPSPCPRRPFASSTLPPLFIHPSSCAHPPSPRHPLISLRTSSIAQNDASFSPPSTSARPSTIWQVPLSSSFPSPSPAPARLPRHRTPPTRPPPSPPPPRLQPHHPSRTRLPCPRPPSPPTRPWLKGPCLPLSQPKAHLHPRPSPLQRGLGNLASKNIRRRRRRHHHRVSLPMSVPLPTLTPPPRANLNRSYFTNRQDRYVHFNAQPGLADYCFSFLQLISSFSYNIFSSPSIDAPIIQWPDPSTQPWKIHSKLHNALSQFQAAHLTPSPATTDTLLFPLIQGGQFNIREEERTLSILFDHVASHHSNPAPAVTWTSGYFGLYKPYQDMILSSPAACDIISASPKVVPYTLYFPCFLISCRQTVSMAPLDCLVSSQRGILCWNKGSCAQRVQPIACPINATIPSRFQNGNVKTGPTTPRVSASLSRSPPSHSSCIQASGFPIPEIVPPR